MVTFIIIVLVVLSLICFIMAALPTKRVASQKNSVINILKSSFESPFKHFQFFRSIINKTPNLTLILIALLVGIIVTFSLIKLPTLLGSHQTQPRFIVCPACGGAGQVERPWLVMREGPVFYNKQTCGICGGTGSIEPPEEPLPRR